MISLLQSDISELNDAMVSYRGLANEIYKYPKRVEESVEKYKIQSDIVYYPCDIVELRKILSTNSIYNQKQICLFSLGFAKKHLKRYPVFIGIKTNNEFDTSSAVIVLPSNDFCLGDRIKRIYIIDNLSDNQIIDINKIVSDERPELSLDIFPVENVPAISKPVLSASVFNLKKVSQIDTSINLTNIEKQIFDFLIKAKNSIPQARNVELRICGGWTRDKLLGTESDDIDIAISSMSGIEFAQLLQQYADSNNIADVSKAYAVSLEKSSEPSKEDANPDLMVGGIKIFGQKIEFVPMRTETYTAESRQPIIQRTDDVNEDVVRRDLTINALYYNIETGQVEDYVGGLEDLKSMTLKTPLSPEKTFQDDPLRMLRVLRFYSRFPESTIAPEVLSALNNPEVQAFYGPPKLAPERASKEFVKMMSGAKPSEAIKILFDSGLYKKVLGSDAEFIDVNMDQKNPHHKLTVGDHIISVLDNANQISKKNEVPDNERGMLNLSAFFHDFGKMYPGIQQEHPKRPGEMQYLGHEEKSSEFAKEVMTRMGFDKDVKKFVETVVTHHMWPFMLKREGMKQKSLNKHMGKFLSQVGDLYDKIIYHSHADMLGKGELAPEKIDEIEEQKTQQNKMLRRYREEVGTGITTKYIDGKRIDEILMESAPELVNNNAFFNIKGKMVHRLAFISDKLMEKQWMRVVTTPEEAEQFVRDNAGNWLVYWKKQQGQEKQSGNWFRFLKADASSVPEEIGLTELLEKDKDVTRVNYTAISPFQIGDGVRLRAGGFGFGQIEGRVKEVGDNSMRVEIQTGKYKGREVTVDLLDASKLSMTWEKIQ